MLKNNKSKLILRISLTAMFLAFAVVSKFLFSINIPILGAGGMKVGFAGVFTAFPAILFGPLYGGMASGLSDFLGYVFKPDGAYIPWLTITAFIGGCLKGLLWKYIFAKEVRNIKSVRIVLVSLLLIIGAFGMCVHISLNTDGIMNGFVAKQNKLPTKGAITSFEISPFSNIALELAKYNNDTITLSSAEDKTDIKVPSHVIVDGKEYKITKIGKNAFTDCASLERLYIPSEITTIDATALEGLSGVTIIAPDGSEAKKFAESNGLKYEVLELEKTSIVVDSSTFKSNGFTVKSSDTYRKYLAGYINFMTIGLEFISALSIAFIFVDYYFTRKSKKNYNFLKIFVTIFTSGLVVTTINTEILKYFMAAWNGRQFMILWIPRAVEEMVVCLIQAYIISILYGIYISKISGRGRFADI